MPYRTQENRIDGVVIILVDIIAFKSVAKKLNFPWRAYKVDWPQPMAIRRPPPTPRPKRSLSDAPPRFRFR